ncbi:transposase [Saccharothrix syringae]|uniref:transposase n=1 Tax=Saccharothrix syringae TaxID=103733 RepID=UPI001D170867|nr:transposase [Saccharothrix syringae]
MGQPAHPPLRRDARLHRRHGLVDRLPAYAPDLNPVEGIWSVLRRRWLSNVAFTTLDHLVRTVRQGLRKIQYRSDIINGCLTGTGLQFHPT